MKKSWKRALLGIISSTLTMTCMPSLKIMRDTYDWEYGDHPIHLLRLGYGGEEKGLIQEIYKKFGVNTIFIFLYYNLCGGFQIPYMSITN